MNELHQGYAQALIELSEPNDTKRVASALNELNDAFHSSKELNRLLCSPSFSVQEKDDAVKALFPSFAEVPHLFPFLHLVGKNGRWKDFPGICEAYLSIYYDSIGVKLGILYGAFPMSKEQISIVENALGQKLHCQVVLRFVLDQNLIGGIKVAINGKVFDGSVKNKLAELGSQLH